MVVKWNDTINRLTEFMQQKADKNQTNLSKGSQQYLRLWGHPDPDVNKALLYINSSIMSPMGGTGGRVASHCWLNFHCGATVSVENLAPGGRGHRSAHSTGLHFLGIQRDINQHQPSEEVEKSTGRPCVALCRRTLSGSGNTIERTHTCTHLKTIKSL